jgi:type IV pilus assembly protein PilF
MRAGWWGICLAALLIAGCAADAPSMGGPKAAKTQTPGVHKSTTKQSAPDLKDAAAINVQLGVRYLNRGDLRLAKLKLDRALEQQPNVSEVQWAYALLQQRLGEKALAEKHFRKAIALDPKDAFAHNNFGVFLCANNRLDEAQKEFERAYTNPLYETPQAALTNAGMCHQKGGNVPEAERRLRQALEVKRDYPPALLEMAKINFEQGLYVPAQAFLKRHTDAAGENPESLWLAIRTEWQLNQFEAAARLGERLKKDFADSKEAGLYLQTERSRKAP